MGKPPLPPSGTARILILWLPEPHRQQRQQYSRFRARLPSVVDFEKRLNLEREAINLRDKVAQCRRNTAKHKLLVDKLKTEMEFLDGELETILAKEECVLFRVCRVDVMVHEMVLPGWHYKALKLEIPLSTSDFA
ncbi:hypothetical protein cyc_05899 [Cyclospora cayetanensis]|uniref:Uncharacterized protein n=1 Tax=Cyclospora cayetanensis TaxID=88456 RepID=A0A1D3D2S7_9EIME|nr:hypothetical protein cyc_05899 [Cyclospora cayetanensis]